MGKIRKPKSIQQLKKILDKHFSLYIRTKYSKDGLVACFTCDRLFPIKGCDAGHFVSRTCGHLRYSEDNVFPQCYYCNRFCEGNKDEYAIRLERKFPGRLEELNKWKHMPPTPFNWIDLKEKIEFYKEKLKTQET